LLFGVSRLIEAVERKGFGANIFNDGAGVWLTGISIGLSAVGLDDGGGV
jgi:hypothetical protein